MPTNFYISTNYFIIIRLEYISYYIDNSKTLFCFFIQS